MDLGGVVVIASAEVVIQWSLAITRVMGSMEKTALQLKWCYFNTGHAHRHM